MYMFLFLSFTKLTLLCVLLLCYEKLKFYSNHIQWVIYCLRLIIMIMILTLDLDHVEKDQGTEYITGHTFIKIDNFSIKYSSTVSTWTVNKAFLKENRWPQ